MISSTAVVACDRCGRTFGQGTEAPFTFCAGCALYVCRSCWSPTIGQCLSCSFPGREPSQIVARRSIRDTIAPPLTPDLGLRIPVGPGRSKAPPPIQLAARSRPAATAAPQRARARPTVRLGTVLSFLVEDIGFRIAVAAMLAVAVIAAAAFVDAGGDALPTPAARTVGNGVSPTGSAPAAAATPRPTEVATAVTTHTVAPGDSLYELAARYYGDGSMWRTIYEANAEAIPDPDRLRVGVTLAIPDR